MFLALARDAIVLEESTHHGKITNKTLACLGDGCEAGLAAHVEREWRQEAADRAALVGAVGRWPEEPCPVGAVALVCTTGESYACWQIVETIPLPSP